MLRQTGRPVSLKKRGRDLVMYFITIAQLQDGINSVLDHLLDRRNRIAIDKRQHVTML